MLLLLLMQLRPPVRAQNPTASEALFIRNMALRAASCLSVATAPLAMGNSSQENP